VLDERQLLVAQGVDGVSPHRLEDRRDVEGAIAECPGRMEPP
jgi:hypothetical protein